MPPDPAPCTTAQAVVWVAGIPPLRQCPQRHQSNYNWLLQSYADYQHHHLPYSGGSLEQPAWIMDAINIIAEVMAEGSDNQPTL